MRLELAQEKDSERLKEFFARMILPGIIDFSVRRHGSFFDHYRAQSDDFETVMLVDENEEIQGVASLIFQEGIIDSERQTFGFATDLRIAPTRNAVRHWSQHFLPMLERALQTRRCRYIFSALELHDNQAYNALIRPQHLRRRLPRYYLLRRFHLVAVYGKLPLKRSPLEHIRLSRLEVGTVSELVDYLRSKSLGRPFTLLHDEENFLKRVHRTPGLELNDFRIARDSQGKIIGCAAPWSPSPLQSFVPVHYGGFAATIRQSLKLATLMRLARPLPKPLNPLKIRYLTHLNVDHPEVFHRLADDAMNALHPDEILVYGHFRGNLVTLPPKGWIVSGLPFALYTVQPAGIDLPELLHADPWRPPPEFEISWL